ncbi:transcriptional regulator GutM [Chelativorans salis]|uniref:Transcriptional regulator n=1 Tax=Chelativorans salis TaxID=2978478 RepID=A0ABT2LL31_9HYPH|nr:transcriptional regulator GutM [Chelativorans sp. EGI FJ00035]MCT7374517.1 transcriptional regulator [Chelativorans sp. EGI FJ00035]
MAIWQWAILALAAVWALQSFGVWLQMRHYTDVMKGISNKYSEGYIGAGNAKGRLGKGVIVLVVVDEALRVERFLQMSGRSVFAKFARVPEYEGLPLDALRDASGPLGRAETGVAVATARAIEQIDRARGAGEEATTAVLRTAEKRA